MIHGIIWSGIYSMFRKYISKASVLAVSMSALLAGCVMLPRSGPDDRAIVSQATSTLSSADLASIKTKYALLEINDAMLPYFEQTLLTSFAPGFKGGRATAPVITVGVGDTVQVTVFESASGGLFIPSEGGARPGNFVALPKQEVDRSGTITVPYVGRVKAAGFSTGAIERAIVDSLKNRAIEPQAVVTILDSPSNQVTILGDVDNSQKVDVSTNGERILDIISRAGGVTVPAEEAYVTVTRGGRKTRVLFKHIIDNPKENVFVYPGDTIFIDRERRTYVVMGASGSVGRVDFSESDLNLAEALGEGGGLDDQRADPAQVFVYRLVDRHTLLKVGADLTDIPGSMVPTVFRINLREPSAMFRARKFAMQDRDILYVSNADSIELFKFLDFVTGVTGAASTTANNINSTKTGIRALDD